MNNFPRALASHEDANLSGDAARIEGGPLQPDEQDALDAFADGVEARATATERRRVLNEIQADIARMGG